MDTRVCGGGLVTKSCPTLATPWTVACQAPLPMEFSRQEYWSRLEIWKEIHQNALQRVVGLLNLIVTAHLCNVQKWRRMGRRVDTEASNFMLNSKVTSQLCTPISGFVPLFNGFQRRQSCCTHPTPAPAGLWVLQLLPRLGLGGPGVLGARTARSSAQFSLFFCLTGSLPGKQRVYSKKRPGWAGLRSLRGSKVR